jgi:transposase
MKKLVIGFDVSKDSLDYCILQGVDRSIESRGVIRNDKKSILKWIKKLGDNHCTVSMEHTGNYGALLASLLTQEGICFYMVNPLDVKMSMGVQRGKTDAVDAYRIAMFTISNAHRLKPYRLPTEKLRKLKVLVTSRERYLKISVQLKNSLRADLILAKTLNMKDLVKEGKKHINNINKTINTLEKQMLEIIRSSQELKESYDKIKRVIGVGPITATKCIIETDNFLSFTNARQFSCYCGLAPFPYQSGSSVKGRTRTHHLRNKALKSILFNAAGSAIQHDPQLKRYYARKVNEGKHKLTVLNAVANKLVLRIFAVVNREEPFVKLSA